MTQPAAEAQRVSSRLRLSRRHAALAAALFVVEVGIALAVHGELVRPYLGDVLVVLLVHHAVLAVVDLPGPATALAALVFAFAVEGAQYAGIGDRLDGHPILQTVIGTTFQAGDLVAYSLGALVAILAGAAVNR